ncbi:MAG: repair protein SbcC/Rad50 [Clostridia bacterium]|nr:repair protein SbcC/Rad50 [Clostridia bacterium]
MIPLELKLRNFLSYGEEPQVLDFSRFHVACLTGENGHGKSALLEAMTWALWGQARGVDERGAGMDDLIRLGAEEMEVEFTFALEGSVYRVLRRRKKDSRSLLDFQVAAAPAGGQAGAAAGRTGTPAGLNWRTLTAETIAATQERINQVLRMDYNTFTNSSFFLQNQADKFTTQKPSERKRILGEILGLSFYDELEALAREEARSFEQRYHVAAQELAAVEAELAGRPQVEAELHNLQAELAAAARQLQDLEKEYNRVLARREELAAYARRAEELRKERLQGEKELEEINKSLAEIEHRRRQYIRVLEREAEIRQGLQKLAAVRQEEKAAAAKLARSLELEQALRDLERRLGEEKARLEAELAGLNVQLQAAREALARGRAAAGKLPEYEAERQRLAELLNTETELLNRVAELEQAARSCESQAAELEKKIEELRRKYRTLNQPLPACPLCRSPLTPEAREQVLAEMAREGQEMVARQQELKKAAADRLAEAQDLRRRLTEIGRALSRRSEIEQQWSLAAREAAEGEKAGVQVEELERRAGALSRIIKEGDFAPEIQAEYRALQASLAAVGYDAAEHRRLQAELQKLLPYEQEAAALETARQLLQAAEEHEAQLQRTLVARQAALAQGEELLAQLERLLAEEPVLAGRAVKLEEELGRARARLGELERRRGHLQGQLERLEGLKARQEELVRARDEAAREKGMYAELAQAFGKNGLQAIIIENALPEIEEEANRILSRLTDGRMAVYLRTQKIGKTSRRVQETLDILIADELGTRRYETFSGGEAFRVNFALRLALSRLLTRRAGARLQTLVIDEGFGSQDSRGRERLVEAIRAIQDDFARIIVITHLDELKEAFPVQIEIVKGPKGSEIRC